MRIPGPLRLLLWILAAVALVAASAGFYARGQLIPAHAWSERAESVAADPAVRTALVTQVGDLVADRAGNLPGARSAGEQVARSIVRTDAFSRAVGSGAVTLQQQLLASPGATSSSLPLGGAASAVRQELQARLGALASLLPEIGSLEVDLGDLSGLGTALDVARRLADAAVGMLVAGLALLGLGILGAPSVRRGFAEAAFAIAAGAGLLALAEVVGRGTLAGALSAEGTDPRVTEAVWRAYLEDLGSWSAGVAVAAFVLAVVLAVAARGSGGGSGSGRGRRSRARTPRPAREPDRPRVSWQ